MHFTTPTNFRLWTTLLSTDCLGDPANCAMLYVCYELITSMVIHTTPIHYPTELKNVLESCYV